MIASGNPGGLNNSEVFVSQIIDLCKGKNTGLTIKEINLLFDPQWKYQEIAKEIHIEKGQNEIDAFILRGINLE